MILEHDISLIIFDTYLGAQGMEDICELWHCLVPFMSWCGPYCIQVIITTNKEVLLLNSIIEGLLGECDYK
jgi:hypothetical protein